MDIFILTPTSQVRSTGNRGTAQQWARFLSAQGYSVAVGNQLPDLPPSLLIVLHAEKNHDAALAYKQLHPNGNLILGLTGTDIYPGPSTTSIETMAAADAMIALQAKAPEQVPPEFRTKVRVIVQSAERTVSDRGKNPDRFQVCVVGHLREVKDPMLAARASRLLPSDSTIEIIHAGGILEPKYESIVQTELSENPRYRRIGEVSAKDIATLESTSHLMVLSSFSEGGGRVVGEAIVHGTPVLSSRIVGIEGLLGEEYPGFFPVGAADALAELLSRCETDSNFYASLKKAADDLAPIFSPEKESQLLSDLVDSLLNP